MLGKAAYFLHLSFALFVKYLLPGKAAHYLHLSVALFMAPSQAIHHHPPVAEPLISQLGPSHAETPIASLHHARSTLLHAKTCLWIQIRSTF